MLADDIKTGACARRGDNPHRRRACRGTAMLLASMLALTMAAGCGGAEEREARYVDRGVGFFEEGDLVKAELEFRNALQINPRSLDARFYMARMAEEEGDVRRAFRAYRALAEDQPGHFPTHTRLGQLYALGGELDEAETQADLASEIDPDHADVFVLRSTIAFGRERFDESRQLAEAALALDSANESAALLLAQTLRRLEQPGAAFAVIDQALEGIPESVPLRLLKISMFLEADELDRVHEVYEALFAVQPDNYAFRANLAQIYLQRNRSDDAAEVMRQAVRDGVGGDQPKLALIDLAGLTDDAAAAMAVLEEFAQAEPSNAVFQFKLASMQNQAGQRDGAKQTLRAIVDRAEQQSDQLAARVSLARLAIEEDDTETAERLVEAALAVDPAYLDALILRSALALQAGDIDSAIVDARSVLRDRPDSAPALRLLAQAQITRGETDLARESLQQAVVADPRDVPTRQRLASALAQGGNVDAAVSQLDQILALDPTFVQALHLKASLQITRQRWAEAEAAIAEILALPGRQALGHTLSGALMMAQGRHDEAVAAYERALDLAPGAVEPLTGLTMAALAKDTPEAAVAYLSAVIEQNPLSAVAHNLLGEVHVRQRQWPEAREAFRQAIALREDWPTPRLNLGRILLSQGDEGGALAVFQEGLEAQPDSAEMLMAVAEVRERTGDVTGAVDAYERVIARQPDNDVAINNLAALIADYHYDDPARLERALRQAQRFETSNNPYFLDTLGWLQYRSGDLRQARINLRRAVALMPDHPQLQYHLGMVLAALGDTPGAHEALSRAVPEGARYPGVEDARAALAEVGETITPTAAEPGGDG
ncbi:MAG: tetratricopeptide repeat protein [Rhodospirillales bacterium]|nr:MAG: tetratricopeptide repeat protein [Rhodospirillales bacterium]